MDQTAFLKAPYFEPAAAAQELASIWKGGGAESERRAKILARLKTLKNDGREAARLALEADGDGRRCAEGLSLLQDELIRVIYDFATTYVYPSINPSAAEHMAVIATGGYGRGMMAPGSDVDLLFLLPYKQTAWGESVAEYILYFLWDLGLKVGHATRTVPQTQRFARMDMTIRTTLLDARLITGDTALLQTLQQTMWDLASGTEREFIAAKLKERDERHERTGASRYRVEPNIKDGKGGLRDLHTLHWLATYLNPGLTRDEFVSAGLLSQEEYHTYLRCEEFLWTARCHLHFLCNKAEERLSFDVQPLMAERLKYKERGALLAVERFMKHYFLVAKDVGDVTRTVVSSLEVKQLKPVPGLNSLMNTLTWRARARLAATSDFRIENSRLTVKSTETFRNDPVNLIRLFAIAEEHQVLLHPDAIRLVRASLRLIGDRVRSDKEANRLFMSLLTSHANSENSLRAMNEAGVLGRFIPDFGRIVAMTQFNMYHHYTVDEHTIRAVGVLSEIEHGKLGGELPLATGLIRDIQSREALYFATFLHDVAKGRPEDHSVAGAQLARELGPRLGLSLADTETAAWLVEKHLVMSQFAQSRDLSDPKTICDFAEMVQSPERLKLLLLLTVADIRAVGPGIWTGWKGQLLRTLYQETEPLVAGGHTTVERPAQIRDAREKLHEALTQRRWSADGIARFIERQPPAYWLRTELEQQIAHATLMQTEPSADQPIVYAVRTDSFRSLTAITVFTHDHARLLSMLAGACAAAGANIVGAQISTTRDGMALDTIYLQKVYDDADEIQQANKIMRIASELVQGTRGLDSVKAERRRILARVEAFSVRPQVIIDNAMSDAYTVVEVNARDRPGLLFDITSAISEFGLDIASAHVATFGEKAVDVFYVTDQTRHKIHQDWRKQKLREELLAALDNGTR